MKNPCLMEREVTTETEAPGGVRGAVSRTAGMLRCLVGVGAHFFGTICMLWRVSGG